MTLVVVMFTIAGQKAGVESRQQDLPGAGDIAATKSLLSGNLHLGRFGGEMGRPLHRTGIPNPRTVDCSVAC